MSIGGALASGLVSQQRNIDTIANNIANVQTAGYKRRRVEFSDLAYREPPQIDGAEGQEQVVTGRLGQGVEVNATLLVLSPGQLTETGNPLDLALEGSGFLQVRLPNGATAYTRDGQLSTDAQGRLATQSGFLVSPEITLPPGSQLAGIDEQGRVMAFMDGEEEARAIGQITLARFANPEGLESAGGNLYTPTAASGEPVEGQPGAAGFAVVRSGMVEESNVDLGEELTRLMRAQRAYQIGISTIRAWDEANASKLRG